VSEELASAQALLPGATLVPLERLGGNDRAAVHRVQAEEPDGATRSLIVKQYFAAGEGWVREFAALSVLPSEIRAPHIVAAGAEPPVLIMDDVGKGPSLADALLGKDPDAAAAAVRAWALALAELHVATRGSRAAFAAALKSREGDLPVGESRVTVDIVDAVRVLDRECVSLGVRVPDGAFDELRALAKRLSGATLGAITPADACPDNNVRTEAGLVLVDFEGAQWRHIAWDVAYLRVPWPSCWCSWRMPDAVADHAVAAYRTAAAEGIPQVEDDAFERDVEAAAVGWALVSTSWFIDNALGSDPALHPDRPTPTRRAMIMHRLAAAARSNVLPGVAELAGALAAELRNQWGDVPLAFAPAFAAAQ
jgi:hypothetical protein